MLKSIALALVAATIAVAPALAATSAGDARTTARVHMQKAKATHVMMHRRAHFKRHHPHRLIVVRHHHRQHFHRHARG